MNCPVHNYVKPLCSNWGMPLLAQLSLGAKRFLELKEKMSPITSRSLSRVLEHGMKNGCVIKSETYELTLQGRNVFDALTLLMTPACDACPHNIACRSLSMRASYD